jgi:uncharacterized lipoprotein
MRAMLLVIACLAVTASLAGCGGEPDLVTSCQDRHEAYEDAVEHGKIKVPEDLDEPDELKQLPLPEAAPAADRPANAPCLELPPGVGASGEPEPSDG